MNWRARWTMVLVGLVPACGLIGGDDEPAEEGAAPAASRPLTQTPATPTAPDTGSAAQDTGMGAPASQQPAPAPATTTTPVTTASTGSLMDEPWSPTQTGTVNPGMSRDEVVGVWGPPVAERTAGAWMYLYFRNGCEVSCGTFDVVFLENGQVVDAIVRGPGHTYGGTSSSPPGREAVATPPTASAGSAG